MDSKTTIPHNKLIQLKIPCLCMVFTMQKCLRSLLIQYTIYATQHLHMKDYLQETKPHLHSDHFMQIH